MKVKIDVYSHFKLADSFVYEYDILENSPSMTSYAKLVRDRHYYPYDTIDIDNGRIILIPVDDSKIFVMARSAKDENREKNIYEDYYMNINGEVIDLINDFI